MLALVLRGLDSSLSKKQNEKQDNQSFLLGRLIYLLLDFGFWILDEIIFNY